MRLQSDPYLRQFPAIPKLEFGNADLPYFALTTRKNKLQLLLYLNQRFLESFWSYLMVFCNYLFYFWKWWFGKLIGSNKINSRLLIWTLFDPFLIFQKIHIHRDLCSLFQAISTHSGSFKTIQNHSKAFISRRVQILNESFICVLKPEIKSIRWCVPQDSIRSLSIFFRRISSFKNIWVSDQIGKILWGFGGSRNCTFCGSWNCPWIKFSMELKSYYSNRKKPNRLILELFLVSKSKKDKPFK